MSDDDEEEEGLHHYYSLVEVEEWANDLSFTFNFKKQYWKLDEADHFDYFDVGMGQNTYDKYEGEGIDERLFHDIVLYRVEGRL